MTPTPAQPFFVVGAQRSGTTMLRLMLNRHPLLHVPFESRFIPDFARHPLAAPDTASAATMRLLLPTIMDDDFVRKGQLVPDPQRVLAREPASYPALVDAIFDENARIHGKVRWGDKTPSYVLEMDCLWSLFPGCRFVHLVRDGRDVACSLRRLSWGSRDLLHAARDWRWKVTMGRKMGAMVPGHYLELRYEDLVLRTEPTLQRLCAFLGVAYDPAMLDYPVDATRHMPDQSLQWHRASVSAPDPGLVGLWRDRLGKADLRVFEEVAGDALEAFGYERTRAPRTLASRVQYARYALFGHA